MATRSASMADPIDTIEASKSQGNLAALKNQHDIETQNVIEEEELNTSSTDTAENSVSGLEDNSKVPRLPLLKLFWFSSTISDSSPGAAQSPKSPSSKKDSLFKMNG